MQLEDVQEDEHEQSAMHVRQTYTSLTHRDRQTRDVSKCMHHKHNKHLNAVGLKPTIPPIDIAKRMAGASWQRACIVYVFFFFVINDVCFW